MTAPEVRMLVVEALSRAYWHGRAREVYASASVADALLASLSASGWAVVPREPAEAMIGGDSLARTLMLAFDMEAKSPQGIFRHLHSSGIEPPTWLCEELKDDAPGHVLPKATRCLIIYRAMIAAGEAP